MVKYVLVLTAVIMVASVVVRSIVDPPRAVAVRCDGCGWRNAVDPMQVTFTCRNPQCHRSQWITGYLPTNVTEQE